MIFELLNQFLFLFVHCPLSIVNLNPRCAKTDTNIREPFITSEDFEYARTLMKKLKSPDTGAERIDNIAPNVTKPDYRPNLSEGDVNFRGRPLRFAVDHINNIPMVHDDVIDLDNAVSDKLKIWTFGLVPHRVSLKFNDTQRAIIAMAMEEFHNKTCIQWIKARPHEQDYVMLDLAPNPTCSSEIGKNPGKNQMLLSPICLENMGNIVHEMMHALGFIHEHCRHDRDKYVDIQWDNIPNGRINKNYLIYGLNVIDNLNTNYDYSSVMHYPRYNKGKEIVVPKIDVKIGQRDGLSPNDVYKIKKLYKCDGADDLAPICDRKIECVRKAQDSYCKTNSVEMLQNCSSYCALCSKTNVTTSRLRKMQQGYLITAGGFNDVGLAWSNSNKCYAYDIDAGSWVPLPNLPSARIVPLVAHEGRVYGIGGHVGEVGSTRNVIKLSTSQNNWIEGPPLHVANGAGSNALTLNGSLFKIGGYASSVVETYSCGSGDFVWNTVAPSLQPHDYSGAAVLDGKIYVCGTTWGTASTFCECYDPALNQWKPIKPMNEARMGLAMVALNGYLFVIGGAETNNEHYDPVRDEWTFFSATPNSPYFHAAVTDGNKIYVIGGSNADYKVDYNGLYVYIPELDIWQSYVNYPLAMRCIGATFVKQLPS